MRERIEWSLAVSGLSLVAFVFFVFMHNLISGLIGREESVFFLLSFVCLFVFAASLLFFLFYIIATWLAKIRKKGS